MYCIYSGKEVLDDTVNLEHIIPLSLGGRNDFTIPVSKEMNAYANQEIDEKLARCFFLATNRHKHSAKGHRRKAVRAPRAKITVGNNTTPGAFRFDASGNLEIFDPLSGHPFSQEQIHNEGFKIKTTFDPILRLRFTAKVGLATAFSVIGKNFKGSTAERDLRALMNIYGKHHVEADIYNINSKVWFWPHHSPDNGKEITEVLVELAHYVNCSFVALINSIKKDHLLIAVGILGEPIGCIFCELKSSLIPQSNNFDLGHVILLSKNKTNRMSMRMLLLEFSNQLSERT